MYARPWVTICSASLRAADINAFFLLLNIAERVDDLWVFFPVERYVIAVNGVSWAKSTDLFERTLHLLHDAQHVHWTRKVPDDY